MPKILYDCIVTADPDRCSTTAQFITLAGHLLKEPGVFIYWPIPSYLTEDQKAYYPKNERIKYFDVPMFKDRMKEYNRISPEMEKLLSFNGLTWDWDVLVTVRSTQVPVMRILSTSPRNYRNAWTKKIILIEDMMISSKKPTVALSSPEVQDRMTIEAYLAADAVFIPAYHQVPWIKQVAKDNFSPARVRDALSKVKEVCHLNMPKYTLKTKFKYDGKRKLGVGFVGRLEKFDGRIGVINDAMLKQFILRSDVMRFFVCTVSPGRKVFSEQVEVLHPKREEFWRISREEMDVAVSMTVDVELNMSQLEPICLGVPLIVIKAPWSVALLGEKYPFFISGPTQLFGMITKFQKNYAHMYKVFTQWFKQWFKPVYARRVKEDGMYSNLMEAILEPKDGETLECMQKNEILNMILEEGGDEFVLFDVITKLGETKLNGLQAKLKDGDWERRAIVWATPWNDFRAALVKYYDYEDASIALGHLRKKEAV